MDPRLEKLIATWPTLSESLKNEILRMTEPTAPTDFASSFAKAFARLDKAAGGYNFVSLVDLRRELPGFTREAFDRGLQQLRRDWVYSLSAAEGRNGTTPEERSAGIVEDGHLLLYVSRRT